MIAADMLPMLKWASTAAPTSGTACTRLVPTSSDRLTIEYRGVSLAIISERELTGVRPTTMPRAPVAMAVPAMVGVVGDRVSGAPNHDHRSRPAA